MFVIKLYLAIRIKETLWKIFFLVFEEFRKKKRSCISKFLTSIV